MVPAPPVRRRLVGRALRRYRENRGYTLSDAARVLECHASKVSRIENGERGIRAKELRELLAEYGIAGEQLEILTQLADPRGAFGWHREYEDDVLHGAWKDYLLLETAAVRIWTYEAQRIPALLQTPAYARALADVDPALKEEAARDRAVEAVMARQQAILVERQTEVRLVVGQAALHQQVGDPEVMSAQLRRLAKVAGEGHAVAVQILPFEAGPNPAAAEGSLSILQLTGTDGLGLVHLGGIAGGVCLEGRADLVAYTTVFDQLRAHAQSSAQSALLLRELADA
jgi:transcriptional regulator with XRE-family HTH domain